MKILIQTQDTENYGAHDWDGTGACPQYWKCKGGEDYFIVGFEGDRAAAAALVAEYKSLIEINNEYFIAMVCHWAIVADDYMTQDEQDQMRFDGAIFYPTKVLNRSAS